MTAPITMRIGIASREQIKQRTIDIASGKHRRHPDEPRVWFTSLDAILRVLSDKNMLLLEIIRNAQPSSVAELAAMSGQKPANLRRTLNRLEQFGLVEFENGTAGKRAPRVRYDAVAFERHLATANRAA